MALDLEADAAVYFNTDEFGVAATYTPAATGVAVAVTVILNKPTGPVEIGGIGVSLDKRTALLRLSEVAAPLAGDTLVVGSETLTVRRAELDATGILWDLALS